MKLHKGKELYFVGNQRHHRNEHVTVEKVGRKWAYLSNRYRIDIKTWRADGGDYSSPGRCYETKEEYDEEIELSNMWKDFWLIIQHTHLKPKGITRSKIIKAKDILGLQ